MTEIHISINVVNGQVETKTTGEASVFDMAQALAQMEVIKIHLIREYAQLNNIKIENPDE